MCVDRNPVAAAPNPTAGPRRAGRLRTALLTLACLIATTASAQNLEAPAADWKALGSGAGFGEGRLHVVHGDDGWRIEDAVGETVALPFAAKAWPNDLERQGDHWWAVATEPTADGLVPQVVAGRGSQVERLSGPSTGAKLARDPVLLTSGKGLEALLWLEGPSVRQLVPKAATWGGEGWNPAVELAPVGPGTQIALTATVLADGSWLAAWAAFDGADDEILWSRAVDGRWSEAQRLATDNDVPDVTPHLRATTDGALIAWSRFDGSVYRVEVARFDDQGWSLPRTLGDPGTGFPRFLPGDTPLLAFQHSHPRAWSVVEMGDEGTPGRRAYGEAPHQSPPRIRERADGGLTLVWDGETITQGAALTKTVPWSEGEGR